VKLGKNASDIFAMLSEAYGGEAIKNQMFLKWREQFKGSSRQNHK
jgi:hypothetical protein